MLSELISYRSGLQPTSILGVFSPHNTDLDQDVERDLATPIQPSEGLKAFSLQELTKEIKLLNPRRAPGMNLITVQMLKELPHEGLLNLLYTGLSKKMDGI